MTLICYFLAAGFPAAMAADAGDRVQKETIPFTVAGTVISARQNTVLIRTGKDAEQRKRKNQNRDSEKWLHEGESFQDYRIVKINKDKVLFEHKGKKFTILVGYGSYSPRPASSITASEAKSLRGKLIPPAQAITPELPAARDKQVNAKFIPPPENADEVRANAQAFFDKLRKNPQFMKKVEEMRPIIRKRLETANASRTPAAEPESTIKKQAIDSPASTSK